MLSFWEFVRLGAHQWHAQRNPFAALFFRLIGPLGTHARIRNARVINALRGIDLCRIRALDLGCGYGYTLFWMAQRFPDATLEGIDVDPQQVDECNLAASAQALPNLTFRQGTFQDLPDQQTYDLLISIDVLEHVEDDLAMLRKMVTVLVPGGIAIIHVPLRHQVQQRVFPFFARHTVSDHVRDEYLPEEIRDKVEHAGFEILRLEYGFGMWGELSFELNNLFWRSKPLRNLVALWTLPISLSAGYIDARSRYVFGNSILLVARRPSVR